MSFLLPVILSADAPYEPVLGVKCAIYSIFDLNSLGWAVKSTFEQGAFNPLRLVIIISNTK